MQLFERGNIKCPICFAAFTRDEVYAGKKVTLEHVPPKFIRGQARCLTCNSCNARTGRNIDQAAALARPPYKVTVNVMGKQDSFLISPDGKQVTTPFARYTPQEIEKSKTFTMSLTIPHPDAVATSSLKAAYLAVFSLLGPMEGYNYVCGDALTSARQQIMDPINHGAIKKFVFNTADNTPNKDIFLLSHPVPCWLVKIENQLIVLPGNGENSTDEPLSDLRRYADMEGVSCSGNASWKFQTFGTFCTIRVHLEGATKYDSLVGLTIRGKLPSGQTVEGTCIQHKGESATLLCTDKVFI